MCGCTDLDGCEPCCGRVFAFGEENGREFAPVAWFPKLLLPELFISLPAEDVPALGFPFAPFAENAPRDCMPLAPASPRPLAGTLATWFCCMDC